jgi:FkbM family methyltransferase
MTAFAVPVRRMKCSYVDNELALPDTPLARMAAEEVLQGKAYPRVDGLEHIKTIVDVGANIGMSALYFHHLYPEATIHCFEPSPTSCELLAYNTRGIQGCKIYPYGLAGANGKLPLRLGVFDCVQDSFYTTGTYHDQSVEAEVRSARCALSRLSAIDILKIDTEGCEDSILLSLDSPILSTIRVVYLETHSPRLFAQCYDVLRRTHYLYRGKQDNAFRGEWVFLRHDVHAEIAEKNKEIV